MPQVSRRRSGKLSLPVRGERWNLRCFHCWRRECQPSLTHADAIASCSSIAEPPRRARGSHQKFRETSSVAVTIVDFVPFSGNLPPGGHVPT